MVTKYIHRSIIKMSFCCSDPHSESQEEEFGDGLVSLVHGSAVSKKGKIQPHCEIVTSHKNWSETLHYIIEWNQCLGTIQSWVIFASY